MEVDPKQRMRATGRDIRRAYEAMKLSRREAAQIMAMSESRLAMLETSTRPLFNRFNWGVLAALGNEYLRRVEEVDMPECPWTESWAAEWLSEDAEKERSREEQEAAERERVAHRETCPNCAPSVEWYEANPDPMDFLFPALPTLAERILGWLPLAAILVGAIGARVVADRLGNGLLGIGTLLLGFLVFYGLSRAQRAGYLP